MALLGKVEDMLVNVKELTDVSDQMRILKNITSLIHTFLTNNDSGVSSSNGSIFTFDNENYIDLYNADIELGGVAQAVLIGIYSLTTLFSACGNMLVILVLILGSTLQTELTVFIMNLAVADLMMAVFCMPVTFTQVMLGRWIWGKIMCPLVLFMQVTSVSVSIFTNVAIGMDRFWGVMYPLKQKLTRTKARITIVLIWIASFAVAAPQLFVSRVKLFSHADTVIYECNERWGSQNKRNVYTACLTSLTYALPLLILSITYYKVGSKLAVRRTPGNRGTAHKHRDRLFKKSKQKVLKMALAVVITFAMCWLPLHLFTTIVDFNPRILSYIKSLKDEQIFVAVFYVCHWLAMANSFMNPIIFAFMYHKFRKDLCRMCFWMPCVDATQAVQAYGLGRCNTLRSSIRSLPCSPRNTAASKRNRFVSETYFSVDNDDNLELPRRCSENDILTGNKRVPEPRRGSYPLTRVSSLTMVREETNKSKTIAVIHGQTVEEETTLNNISATTASKGKQTSVNSKKPSLPVLIEDEDISGKENSSANGEITPKSYVTETTTCLKEREILAEKNVNTPRIFFWSSESGRSASNDEWQEEVDVDPYSQ